MARQVVWSDPAWEDLEAAAEYIARDSKSYAAAFVQNVKEAAASLAHFAERDQVVPEISNESIREFLVRPYRLIYRITAGRVFILTLIHGALRQRRF
jgi:plasmid stabilization system protein ParE